MILYACSTNQGKLREFAHASGSVVVEPLPGLRDIAPPEETGSTFEENAAIKALFYSRFTEELVFADDSGIEADGLGQEPGIYSGRYAGENATDEENNHLLLERLRNVDNRHGRFVCAIALAQAGKLITVVQGVVEGEILEQPRGENGFGYDPLFFYPPFNRSFGEVPPQQKFQVSHRGQAFRALIAFLNQHPQP